MKPYELKKEFLEKAVEGMSHYDPDIAQEFLDLAEWIVEPELAGHAFHLASGIISHGGDPDFQVRALKLAEKAAVEDVSLQSALIGLATEMLANQNVELSDQAEETINLMIGNFSDDEFNDFFPSPNL